MKTTTKEFKKQVQEYIIDCLCTDYTTDLKEQLQNVVNEFKWWYSDYNKKRIPNKQEAFEDFLNGLPSCLSIDYITYNIYMILAKWFKYSLEDAFKYSEMQTCKMFLHLISREFKTLCKQNNIEF